MMSLVLYYKQDRIIVVYWRGDSQLEHTLQHNKEKTKITIAKLQSYIISMEQHNNNITYEVYDKQQSN